MQITIIIKKITGYFQGHYDILNLIYRIFCKLIKYYFVIIFFTVVDRADEYRWLFRYCMIQN
jgi:hypothetical protein